MAIRRNNLDVHLVPIGGLFVTDKEMYLQTVLGSCVSVTLFDPVKKNAGMNHILLPGSFSGRDQEEILEAKDGRYGIFSVEKLFHEIQSLGSRREDLEARVFGGSYLGRISEWFTIQNDNVDFVKAFLEMAKITVVEEVTLQDEALKIIMNTSTGRVEVQKLKNQTERRV
jgi:chemotaxis protein CheD